MELDDGDGVLLPVFKAPNHVGVEALRAEDDECVDLEFGDDVLDEVVAGGRGDVPGGVDDAAGGADWGSGLVGGFFRAEEGRRTQLIIGHL